MNQPEQPNHWQDLAANLGLNVDVNAEPPAPKRAAPPPRRPAAVERRPWPAAPRRPAADWDSLAVDLGLPPAAASEQRDAATSQQQPRTEREITLEREPRPSTRAAHEVEPPAIESSVEEREPTVERKRRRRRRRGGAGRREARGPLPTEEPIDETRDEFAEEEPQPPREAEEDSATALMSEMMLDAAAEIIDVEQPRTSPDGDEGTEARESERRRRKRRRRRRRDKEDRDQDRDALHKELSLTQQAAEEPVDEGEDLKVDEESEMEADGEEAAKSAHKGIPSWKETIDFIISGNMAARAKNPRGSSGPPRRNGGGRPGRRRGRSSGG